MDNLKRLFALVMIAAVVSFNLIGCVSTGEPPSDEQPADEQPAGEHPSDEHPAGEHPAGEHPE